jgi:hypothetical protein
MRPASSAGTVAGVVEVSSSDWDGDLFKDALDNFSMAYAVVSDFWNDTMSQNERTKLLNVFGLDEISSI